MKIHLKKIIYLLSKIPIIGALAITSFTAQKEALTELLLSVIFATLPIWFGGLIFSFFPFFSAPQVDQKLSVFISIYLAKIFEAVSNGEILMYVAAMLGPTLYLGLSSIRKKGKPFPWTRPQLVVAILISPL